MGSNPGMALHHGGPFGLSYTAIKNSLSRLQPLMNAIYYECVNERKKNSKKKVEVELTTLGSLIHCSTIFTNTFSYKVPTNFYIESKPCPV
jgi:hypothetical protein